ncbi:MAG: hypothetical protein JNM24_03620 [Bdellovibrionaceae bacterium]|nr:hypothetical protein [Pseudobdellovibrionaceae bacterium]
MTHTQEISIHDNDVLGYEVDSIKRELTIKTEYSEHGASERTNIVFSNIEAYRIENDSFGTILNEIEEIDALKMLENQWELIKSVYGNSIWPGHWAKSFEEAKSHIIKTKCRAFYITSSIGMEGWVMAKSMELIPLK